MGVVLLLLLRLQVGMVVLLRRHVRLLLWLQSSMLLLMGPIIGVKLGLWLWPPLLLW